VDARESESRGVVSAGSGAGRSERSAARDLAEGHVPSLIQAVDALPRLGGEASDTRPATAARDDRGQDVNGGLTNLDGGVKTAFARHAMPADGEAGATETHVRALQARLLECEQLAARTFQLRETVRRKSDEVVRLEKLLHEANVFIDIVQTSRSWRLTAPLRRVGEFVRKVAGTSSRL